MGRFKQQYDVKDLNHKLDELNDFLNYWQKRELSALEKRQLSPGSYVATVEAIFPLNRWAEYVKWKEQIDLNFFSKFRHGARRRKQFPTKFRGIKWVDEKSFSDAAIVSEEFTKHKETLEKLKDSLFMITTITPFHHATKAQVSIDFQPHQNARELNPFSVLKYEMKVTKYFGRMTILHPETIDELLARYSDEMISTVIFHNIRNKNPLVKCLVEYGEPEAIRYEYEDEKGRQPLTFNNEEDIINKVRGFKKTFKSGKSRVYHAGAFYGSVDLAGKNYPSIMFVETDFGDLMSNSQWRLNAAVEQYILDILSDNGIRTVVQFSGSGGFHNLVGLGFSEFPPTYFDILQKTLWDERKMEYSNYGFAKIAAEVIGYLVYKMMEREMGLRVVSIDPIRKWERLFKILIDPSPNKSFGEYHLPCSTHLGSGAICSRLEIDDYRLPNFAYDKDELMKFAQLENIKLQARSNPEIYLTTAPTNSLQTMDDFAQKYRREFELMFWIRRKIQRMQREAISYSRDTVLFLKSEYENEAIKSLYGQTTLDATPKT